MNGVSPVAAGVRVVSGPDAGKAVARVDIDAAEPVFAGHYPDFPIFPGVCVVECAHRAALATAPEPVALAAVDSARFGGAVHPGDTLDLKLTWRRRDDGWRCAATAVTPRGDAASVRLRYRPADGGRAAAPDGPEVTGLLPHRYPMLLVDRVLELVPGRRVTAVKAVTLNEPWYAGLTPGTGTAYPSSLVIESWGQAAGLLASAGAPATRGQVMLFGSVADAEFHGPVHPGELIEHRVTVARSLGDSVIFEGESRCGSRPVMSVARMVMAFRPAGALKEATS
ncbi:3-hydroxyacyl-ACP dehydratase FabZ family protein [Streptomyces cucumeris]|uniref:3-hydroxyacyl-ACP dehydratase FabZ family protein n=1 Tax=Streptomyces cucumeris TaxID=2962890 RepID=UPI003D750EC7